VQPEAHASGSHQQPESSAGKIIRSKDHVLTLITIGVFDIAAPLGAYVLVRSSGHSAVSAMIVSGIFPACGTLIGGVRHRRLDTIGALVLTGLVAGIIVGLVSGTQRAVLLEGGVPTAVFGVWCLVSLWLSRPLLYRLTVEPAGQDTRRGRALAASWNFAEFRHFFRVVTIVWGVVYLAEATGRVVIVLSAPAGTALAVSNLMPLAVTVILLAGTRLYGRQAKRRYASVIKTLARDSASASPGRARQAGPGPGPQAGRG
jgi:hypothetical protein